MRILVFIFIVIGLPVYGSNFVGVNGDSNPQGYGTTGTIGLDVSITGSNYVTQMHLWDKYPALIVTNISHGGDQLAANTDASAILAVVPAGVTKKTFVVEFGSDFAAGRTAAQITNDYRTYAASIRAVHPDAYIIGVTLQHVNWDYPSPPGALTTTIQPRVDAVNLWISTNGGATFDTNVSFIGDARLTNYADTVYFQADQTHLNDVGTALISTNLQIVLFNNNRIFSDYYVRKDGSDSNLGFTNTSAGAFLTIGKAETVAQSGDIVRINTGLYDAIVTHNGASNVTYIGAQATNNGWVISKEFINIYGITCTGSNVSSGEACFQYNVGANHCYASNIAVYGWGSITAAGGGILCFQQTTNNRFSQVTMLNPNKIGVVFAGRGAHLIDADLRSTNGWDCFTIVGSDVLVSNIFVHWENPLDWNPDHTDIFQSFGDNADISTNVVIADFIIEGAANGTVQMGNFTDDQEDGTIAHWTFKNGLWVDISNTINLYAPNFSFLHQTWVRCGPTSGFVIIWGSGSAGHANNIRILNSIMYQCGETTNPFRGWYGGDAITGAETDYNLVIGTGAGTTKTGFTETHGINGQDPDFVSSTDFRVQAGSPCLSAGTNILSIVPRDLLHILRVNPPTIGAYEDTNSVPPPPVNTGASGARGVNRINLRAR